MRVKFKTKDDCVETVKLKCSAMEFLLLKSALKEVAEVRKGWMDSITANLMLKDIDEAIKDAKEC